MTDHLDATGDRVLDPDRRWRRRVLLVLIPAVATAVIFTGGLLAGRGLGGSPAPTAVPLPPTETVTVTAVPTPKPSPPTRLIVRSLEIDAPVVDIDLSTDAVLEPPSDPDLVGWWTGSAKIGATKGRTVITGHTVHDGDGALNELPRLKKGATVQVASYSGLRSYRVTDNLYATYEDVAKHAEDVFGQSERSPGGARLILITCTDFDGRIYHGNSIIVAEPIPDPSASPSATETATDPATESASPTESASASPSETPPTSSAPVEPEPSTATPVEPTSRPTATETATESGGQVPTPTPTSPSTSPTSGPSGSPSPSALLSPTPGRESERARPRGD